MANSTKCSSCWKPTFQVRISGIDLRGKTSQQVYESTLNINTADLKHVAKKTQQDSAFLHFKSHLTASVFYNSKIRSSFVLDGVTVTVQPTILANGEIVHYSQRALPFASSSDPPSELPAERQPSVEREPQPHTEQIPQPSVEHEPQTPAEQIPQPSVEHEPQTPAEQIPQPPAEQTPQPSVEHEPQTPAEQTPQPSVEHESQTPEPQIPEPQIPEPQTPEPQSFVELEHQPMAELHTWKINVKRAIVELRATEKWHEEELASVKKRIRLLEETLY